MNPMLQRHCAKFIYIVPDGLRELMSDISREVIRSQPEQIYTFIADYLDALMITRENARIAAKLIESITEIAEITVNTLVRIGLTREEADRVATIIQRHFREHLAQKKPFEIEEEENEDDDVTQRILDQLDISMEKMEEMTTIIQTAWRHFKERREREKQMLFGMVDWRIAAKSAIALYRRTGVTRYEANRAATLIKAAYKGYYTRRIMKQLLRHGLPKSPELVDEEEEEEEEEEEVEELSGEVPEGEPEALEYPGEESCFYSTVGDETQPTEAMYETGLAPDLTGGDQTQPEEQTFPTDWGIAHPEDPLFTNYKEQMLSAFQSMIGEVFEAPPEEEEERKSEGAVAPENIIPAVAEGEAVEEAGVSEGQGQGDIEVFKPPVSEEETTAEPTTTEVTDPDLEVLTTTDGEATDVSEA